MDVDTDLIPPFLHTCAPQRADRVESRPLPYTDVWNSGMVIKNAPYHFAVYAEATILRFCFKNFLM